MTIVDWRDLPAETVVPLYKAQLARWQSELEWDTSAMWTLVEAARLGGSLPGFAALDRAGSVVGWTFYNLHQRVVQVGALDGRTGATVRRLLNAIMRSPDALHAQDVTCFGLSAASTAEALAARRFATQSFLYLQRRLDEPPRLGSCSGQTPLLTPWQVDDGPDTVRLFAAAYATAPERRCFAGAGRTADWVHYLRQLIHTPGCGLFLPAASFAARDADGQTVGTVITTSISPRGAHVAQLVVDPSRQREGTGAALLRAACEVAGNEGRRIVTLLVAGDNDGALALYHRAGFRERARFIFAWRARPIQRTAAA